MIGYWSVREGQRPHDRNNSIVTRNHPLLIWYKSWKNPEVIIKIYGFLWEWISVWLALDLHTSQEAFCPTISFYPVHRESGALESCPRKIAWFSWDVLESLTLTTLYHLSYNVLLMCFCRINLLILWLLMLLTHYTRIISPKKSVNSCNLFLL